jgi:hypothetical protein
VGSGLLSRRSIKFKVGTRTKVLSGLGKNAKMSNLLSAVSDGKLPLPCVAAAAILSYHYTEH